MTGWKYVVREFDPLDEGRREALCTLGNGYFATRGAAPESCADGVHYPGTYIAGCYNRLTDQVQGETIENESLVNTPNWLPLTVAIDDGPWLASGRLQITDHCQELDMRRGVLTRRLMVREPTGRSLRIAQRRFVHMANPHLAGLETTITPNGWSGRLRVRSAIDGTVRNTGVPRYAGLADEHLETIHTLIPDDETIVLTAETTQSHIRIDTGARTRVLRAGEHLDPQYVDRQLVERPGWVGLDLALDVADGEEITIEKIVAIHTGRDRAISNATLAVLDQLRDAPSFEQLLEPHVLAWAHLWARFGIELDSDDEIVRALRLHLFHVLQTVSMHSEGRDAGVPARGLHGEAYRGHIFWDELFVFPLINLRLPALSRSFLEYRYRRLPAARRGAREAGYEGAMYPWQSGSDGREESQRIHLNPKSGRWVPDVSRRQRHIGIAVAYNVWQYYQATGDRAFLSRRGAEMLIEIARFWASIAHYDRTRDRYVISGVMGPDEFHTGYPDGPETGVDNNAYTNVMAAWVLLRALDALEEVRPRRRRELTESLGLRAEELQRWEDISRRMFVPFHEDGVISQFEGYEDLAELDWTDYRERYGDIQRMDRILEAEGDTPNRYKLSKQADVLMIVYLLPHAELMELLKRLGYAVDTDTISRTIDYYLARTSHGSTLSALVHSWVLARSDPDQAVPYFLRTLQSDLTDIQGGTTREGVHLAAMAGSVDLLQRCFAGVGTREGILWFDPLWPDELGAMEFGIEYRNTDLTVQVSRGQIRISASPDGRVPITCGCAGQLIEVVPGGTAELSF